MEAAKALGATSSAATGYAALHHLIAYYRERCCEADGVLGPVASGRDEAAEEAAPTYVQKAHGPAELAAYLTLQVSACRMHECVLHIQTSRENAYSHTICRILASNRPL